MEDSQLVQKHYTKCDKESDNIWNKRLEAPTISYGLKAAELNNWHNNAINSVCETILKHLQKTLKIKTTTGDRTKRILDGNLENGGLDLILLQVSDVAYLLFIIYLTTFYRLLLYWHYS